MNPAGPAGRVGEWLALTASPTFALMAALTALDASAGALCSPMPRLLPVDGMTAMYGLMSLFHASPWLRLVSYVSTKALSRPSASSHCAETRSR